MKSGLALRLSHLRKTFSTLVKHCADLFAQKQKKAHVSGFLGCRRRTLDVAERAKRSADELVLSARPLIVSFGGGGEPVHQMIDLIAVLVTVLLTGSELAIGVFVHPVLSKLQDAAHAEAAKPLARLLGRVMPFWYAAALLLVIVSLLTRSSGSWSWWACLSSAALLAVTVPFSLICLVPINNRVAAWDLNELPGDWKSDRRRWDQYHAIRIVILVLASVAIMAAVIWRSGVA